jgi:WD40 repeat protein
MALDLVKNYLFTAGFEAGMISVFDIDKPGREKFAKQVAGLEGMEKPRSVVWVLKRMEVLVGMGNGTVTFWNSLKGHPMYVLRADTDEITQIHYDDTSRLLITSSKGKLIKVYAN